MLILIVYISTDWIGYSWYDVILVSIALPITKSFCATPPPIAAFSRFALPVISRPHCVSLPRTLQGSCHQSHTSTHAAVVREIIYHIKDSISIHYISKNIPLIIRLQPESISGSAVVVPPGRSLDNNAVLQPNLCRWGRWLVSLQGLWSSPLLHGSPYDPAVYSPDRLTRLWT